MHLLTKGLDFYSIKTLRINFELKHNQGFPCIVTNNTIQIQMLALLERFNILEFRLKVSDLAALPSPLTGHRKTRATLENIYLSSSTL